MAEEKEVGYHTDDNGNPSNMRAMSTSSLVAAFVCAGLTLSGTAPDPSTGLYLSSMFMVGAFCPKMIQKFAEVKMP